jgi:beta-galactosidase/beta-glucuronidase
MIESIAPSWKPASNPLFTRWAAQVTPDHVLPDYPRPQCVRSRWYNLNGLWDYTIVAREQESVRSFSGEIMVPFPIESALSGVRRKLLPDQRLLYRRRFILPEDWQGQRILLHFGAVDWKTMVWVNRKPVGTHRGGYDPFTFEITPAIQSGVNELVVAVWDPSDQGDQERGKQVLTPDQVFYTAVSGIWQTVWLEPVPQVYIQNLKITPKIDTASVSVIVNTNGDSEGLVVVAEAFSSNQRVAVAAGKPGSELILGIPDPQLWSPESPHLYDLEISLEGQGQAIDRVSSYFGMRKFSVGHDEVGHVRLLLNNQPYFHLAPLDQGYWPDGLYTAPTDEALRFDIETCKRLGFNTIRKHIKVEPARWYYHCDRLGMVVWQDMPSGGKISMPWTIVGSFLDFHLSDRNYARFGRQYPASRDNFRSELQSMVDGLYNFTCIGQWIPFNEGWGQFDSQAIASWLIAYDPTRSVDAASGFFDNRGGDVKSEHQYLRRLDTPKADGKRALVLSEIGGYGLLVTDHAWQTKGTFSYHPSKDKETLTNKYIRLIENEVHPLIERGLSGIVYTQLTDVEGEINGYLTYDRAVEKMDFARVSHAHKELLTQSPDP